MKGLNLVLVVFSLLVLGGSAYYLSTNRPVNLKSGASNLLQTTTGKLVKKGSPDFAPCGKTASFTYGLLGAQVLAANTTGPFDTAAFPAKSGPRPTPYKPTPVPTSMPVAKTPACTPLMVQASLADPLVGKRVDVTGTYQNGIFYATSLKLAGTSPTPKPTCVPRPGCLDAIPACKIPERGDYCPPSAPKPTPTPTYSCPIGAYIDCSPTIIGTRRMGGASNCSSEAIAWFHANCPNFKGAAY